MVLVHLIEHIGQPDPELLIGDRAVQIAVKGDGAGQGVEIPQCFSRPI